MVDELRVVFRDESAFFIFHDEFGSTIAGYDGGNSGSKGLENDISKGIGMRWKGKHVEIGVGLCEVLSAQNPGQSSVRQMLEQPSRLCALTNDHDLELASAATVQSRLQIFQESDVLFLCQPADIPHNELLIVPLATFRMKQLRVNSSRHKRAGFPRESFNHRHQFQI